MSYPQSPWNLQGYAFQTLHFLDVSRVSASIPSALEIVSIWSGKTLGGVYIASYTQGSALIYNELIVVSAIVRHQNKIGAWVSHIYVDNPDSVAGGREIWGLPKELAQFTWQTHNVLSVQVKQETHLLCELNCNWQLPGWQQPISGSAFSVLNANLMSFVGHGNLKLHLANVDLHIPGESSFSGLELGQPWLGLYLNPLSLTVQTPFQVSELQEKQD